MDKKILAERLKYARTDLRSVTMQALADLSGVSASTVQRYETGQINRINMPVVESFARALCVNTAWLLGEDVSMEPPVPKRNYGIVSDISSILSLTGMKLEDADTTGCFRLSHKDETIIIDLDDMDEIITETKNFLLWNILEHSYRRKKKRLVIDAENKSSAQ